jgi:hypothetical protein
MPSAWKFIAAFFAADGEFPKRRRESISHLSRRLLFESGLPASENVSRSKVAHLLPRARSCKVNYNDEVRYYITEPINGGLFCKRSGNTLDFNSTKGDRRIQTAAVMNHHTAALHFSCLQPVSGRNGRS